MMTYRALTADEAKEIMRQLGYEIVWRGGDAKSMGFTKRIDDIAVHCVLAEDPHKPGFWEFTLKHAPGVQMLVQLKTESAQFPHPKFQRFERLMFSFAEACEPVAATAANHTNHHQGVGK